MFKILWLIFGYLDTSDSEAPAEVSKKAAKVQNIKIRLEKLKSIKPVKSFIISVGKDEDGKDRTVSGIKSGPANQGLDEKCTNPEFKTQHLKRVIYID